MRETCACMDQSMRCSSTLSGLAAFVALGLAGIAVGDPLPAVTVEGGRVSGLVQGPAVEYRGIPYAAAPVGALRWAPPQRAPGWTGMRDGSVFGPICPQPPGARRLANATQSEDCLTLNVWAPATHPAKPAPVMVWIHGGGYETGSGSDPLYDGKAFARDGVVLVTINYRLGALGFFAHPALTKAAKAGEPLANYGLMDMVAALGWVQRNIAAFGGDPHNVTLFGESAGGAAVVNLLTAPSARGLFQKAIAESAGFWFAPSSLPVAEAHGFNAAAKAGAGHATAAALRALPVEKLLGFDPQNAMTVVDGRFLPTAPQEALRSGTAADVPLIIGSNTGEGSLIAGQDPKAVVGDIPADTLTTLYGDAGGSKAQARAVFNDMGFSAPARWVADKEASGAPAWLYRFGYVSNVRGDPSMGASHGSELIYVFESDRMYEAVTRFSGAPDIEMAKTIHGCWVEFARSGRPDGCTPQAWAPYDPTADNLMLFGAKAASVTSYRKAQWDWQVEREGLEKAGSRGAGHPQN
jgi:para-nitrobenzyl esterase